MLVLFLIIFNLGFLACGILMACYGAMPEFYGEHWTTTKGVLLDVFGGITIALSLGLISFSKEVN